VLVSVISIIISIISILINHLCQKRKKKPEAVQQQPPRPAFSVSRYLEHTEKAYLEILEEQKPFEYEIVLWWGFDGLRLNKDGTTEWISRKKKEPANMPVPPAAPLYPLYPIYNPCYNIASQANLEDMRNMLIQNRLEQIQSWQTAHLLQAIQSMQNTCIPSPAYNQQLQNCCCTSYRNTNN
jgi:hypothetical protein